MDQFSVVLFGRIYTSVATRRRAITFIVRTIFPMSFIVAVARQPATSQVLTTRHKAEWQKIWLQAGFEPATL